MKKEDVPNKFQVERQGADGVALISGGGEETPWRLSHHDALVLAAWLIKVADSADYPVIGYYLQAAREWK